MKSVTDTLQRVMNAAVRVVSDTRKFDHGLTQILHDDLHWLDVADTTTEGTTPDTAELMSRVCLRDRDDDCLRVLRGL